MKNIFKSFLIVPLAFSIFNAQAGYETSYRMTIEQEETSCYKESIAKIIGALGAGAFLGALIYFYPEAFSDIYFKHETPHRYHYCCDRFQLFNTHCYPCFEPTTQITIHW